MHHCTEININSFCYNIAKISFTYRDSQRTVEVCVPTQYLLYLPITSHIYIAHKSVERIKRRGEERVSCWRWLSLTLEFAGRHISVQSEPFSKNYTQS